MSSKDGQWTGADIMESALDTAEAVGIGPEREFLPPSPEQMIAYLEAEVVRLRAELQGTHESSLDEAQRWRALRAQVEAAVERLTRGSALINGDRMLRLVRFSLAEIFGAAGTEPTDTSEEPDNH